MSLPIQTIFDLPEAPSVKPSDTVLLGQDGVTKAVQVGTLTSGIPISSFSGAITSAQHGNLPGGALHATATTLAPGFMSVGDKVALNGLVLTGSGSISGLFGTITSAQHGTQSSPWLHAAATGSTSGFLSAQDKLALSAYVTPTAFERGFTGTLNTGFQSEYWLSARTDGRPGRGVPDDPFDVSTVDKFDNLLNSFTGKKYITLHIGPGLFQTRGAISNTQKWGLEEGWRIKGAGIDSTIIQLVDATTPNNAYYIIAPSQRALTYGSNQEVSDLTVDCNFSGQPCESIMTSAVVLNGSNCAIRRVRAINFGSRCGAECFVLAINSGLTFTNPDKRATNNVIEECVADSPDDSIGLGGCTVLHMGGGEEGDDGVAVWHQAAVIRNCYVNGQYKRGGGTALPMIGTVTRTGTVATMTFDRPHKRVPGQKVASQFANPDVYNAFVTLTGTTPSTVSWVIEDCITSLTSVGTFGTCVTRYPHRWNVNDFTTVSGCSDSAYNGPFKITAVAQGTIFNFNLGSAPASQTATVDPKRAIGSTPEYSQGMKYTHIPATDSIGNVRIFNNFGNALSIDNGKIGIAHGNRIENILTGGPYHDSWLSRELWVYNNWYRNVFGGIAQNLTSTWAWQRDETRFQLAQPNSLTFAGTVVTATTVDYHNVKTGENVIITGATGPSSSVYNGTFVATSVPFPWQFTYSAATAPVAVSDTGIYGKTNRSLPFTLTNLQRDLTFNASGTVAVANTVIEHGLSSGDTVVINGTGPSAYFGAFKLLAPRVVQITSSSVTSPIVITTSTPHGFSNNDSVFIQGHGPNTNANGMWKITNVTSSTFELLNSSPNSYTGYTGIATNLSDCFPSDTQFRYTLPSNPGASAVTGANYQTQSNWYTFRSVTANGLIATAVTAREHDFQIGRLFEVNEIRGGDWKAINGRHIITNVVDANTFQFALSTPVQYGTLTTGRWARVWTTDRLYFHNNIVELATNRDFGFNPAGAFIFQSPYEGPRIFNYVSIKNNEFRFYTGDAGRYPEQYGDFTDIQTQTGYGVWLGGVKNAVVENNIIDMSGTGFSGNDYTLYGIINYYSGTVTLKNNHTSWGEPVRAWSAYQATFDEDSEAKHVFTAERTVRSGGTCVLFDAVTPNYVVPNRVSGQIDWSIEASNLTDVAVLSGRTTFNAANLLNNMLAGINYNPSNDCLTATSGTISALWIATPDVAKGQVTIKVVPQTNISNAIIKVSSSVLKNGAWPIRNHQKNAEWPPSNYPLNVLPHYRIGGQYSPAL